MLNDYTDDIERFTNFVKKEIDRVSKISIEGEERSDTLHKKLIYSALFDSISKCIFPKKNNKDRIISFLVEFSDWDDHDRVSLPHLYRLLKKNPEPSFTPLRHFVLDNLKNWSEGALVPLSLEPKIGEVKKYWSNGKEYKKTLEGISIEFLQHSHLFYMYRNALVHEFRHLGYGFEDKRDENPFYTSLTHLHDQEEKNTWELVYPVGFFKKIVETSFFNMKKYLLENNINPYLSYTFGTYWIEELNK